MAKQSALNFQIRKRSSQKNSKINAENEFNISDSVENCRAGRNSPFASTDISSRLIRGCDDRLCGEGLEDNKYASPKRKAEFQKFDGSPKKSAKQAFHTSTPTRFVGREREICEITSVLQNHLSQKKPVSMYVSGAPGTGKTSCLIHVLSNMNIKFNLVFINCMTVNSPQRIYKNIAAELHMPKSISSSKNLEKCIQAHITSAELMTVLVLDEIDHLDSRGQEVLYSLFEWPHMPNSTLILIGVANSLDLTDRILPRLQIFTYEPVLINFKPYTHKQIVDILEDRLTQVQGSGAVIKQNAIQLCARKIAACTGDIRKALHVCRRATELAEKEAKARRVLTTNSENSPDKHTQHILVDLSHVTSVLHEVYGSRIQSLSSKEAITLPLQQMILLCSLILMKKCQKNKDITVGKLYDVYKKVCKKRQVSEVGESQFYSLCQLVELRGFIHMTKNKAARMTKVVLKIEEGEAEHVLQDKNLLAAILSDTTVF